MEENIGLEIAREATKEVAKDAYSDAVKPVVQPTGELVGLLPRAIKAALAPVEKWVLQREYNVAETKKLLEVKLSSVPPELIEAPEPHIAVPAIQYISYCMDNEDLRDMYANLLANSMNKVVKNGVHPGFVEIIKQMCPDEAKLIKYIHMNGPNIPLLYLEVKKISGASILVSPVGFTNATYLSGCEYPANYQKYIENLMRLGLVNCSNEERLVDKSAYAQLENHPLLIELKKEFEGYQNVRKVELVEGHLELTLFGRDFCDKCMQISTNNTSELIDVLDDDVELI